MSRKLQEEYETWRLTLNLTRTKYLSIKKSGDNTLKGNSSIKHHKVKLWRRLEGEEVQLLLILDLSTS
jgi:hypothetical protein